MKFRKENCKATRQFWRMYKALDPAARRVSRIYFQRFLENPATVGWKKLQGKQQNHWEAKYDRYRSIAVVEGEAATFHWIGDKKDAVSYIRRLR